MSRRNATANRCCTWQSVAEEIKGLPDQLATRSEALQKRLAPTITQSIIVKIEGLREFDSVALFGLCDALSGWSTGCTASVLSDLSLTVQDAINARNDAEAKGQQRVDANKNAFQQLSDAPHLCFTQSEIDRLADPHTTATAALELIAGRAGKIGIQTSAEDTRRWWIAFHLAWIYERTGAFPSYHSLYDDVMQLKRLVETSRVTTPSGLKTYPQNPADWPRRVYDNAYSADDPPTRCDLPHLVNLALNHIPLRSNNKLLQEEAARTRRDLEAFSYRGKRTTPTLQMESPRSDDRHGRRSARLADDDPFSDDRRGRRTARLAIDAQFSDDDVYNTPNQRAPARRPMTVTPYEFKPNAAPRSRLPALALTDTPHIPQVVPPPNSGGCDATDGASAAPPNAVGGLPANGVPPPRLGPHDSAEAAKLTELNDAQREDKALEALLKRDQVRKEAAAERAAEKRRETAAAKAAANAPKGAAAKAKAGKAAVPAVKKPGAPKGFNMKDVKKVCLKNLKKAALLKTYVDRKEAFGCLRYTHVEKELGPKTSHAIMTATRKWARSELIAFYNDNM